MADSGSGEKQSNGGAKPGGTRGPSGQPLIDLDAIDAPIYLQLITIFSQQITRGTWAVETRLPTIETLATQYGVATGTVRQALGFLERQGLIRRMRRRGTIVIKQPEQPEHILLPRSREELATLLAALTPRDARLEPQADAGNLHRLFRRYLRRTTPVMLERTWFDPAKLPAPAGGDWLAADLLVLPGVDPRSGYSDIAQTVTIGTADTEVARLLTIPVNAGLAIIRQVITDRSGAAVIDSEWLLRGDLFSIVEHVGTNP